MKYLKQNGHLLYVVVPEAGPFVDFIKPFADDIQVIYQDHWTGQAHLTFWQKVKFLRGFYRSAAAMARYAKKQKTEVVLTNTSVIVAGALGAKMAGLPHVWYLHEFVREDHALVWQYGQRFSYKLIDALSEVVVVNSRALMTKVARNIPWQKVRIVHNAAEIDWPVIAESDLPQGPVLLMVGAMHPGKNQELVIRALAEPSLASLGAQLKIIGHGPDTERHRLLEVANDVGVGDRLEILAFEPDRGKVFAQGRILVVASRSEAFGRVTVEAQKSGLPVLAADAGASSELITDGETGLLFNPKSADELAQQAARLFQDKELFSKIRNQALAFAQDRYTLQRHGAAIEKALKDAIKSYAARG